MSGYEQVRVERPRPGVVLATLNRPDRLNAATLTMFDDFQRLIEEVAANDEDRVLVVTGAGRAFCAGFDLDEAGDLAGMPAADMLADQETWSATITGFAGLPKPVIAAVNGACVGVGFSLALLADLRVASTAARFSAAFVKIGLSAGDCGTSWTLPRLVGMGNAAEIMLTGRLVDAEHALRIGMVNAVVEPDGLLDAAFGLADEIVANSPFGVRLTKQVLRANVDAPSLAAAVAVEDRNQVLATRTADHVEALAAFREKRPPTYTGR